MPQAKYRRRSQRNRRREGSAKYVAPTMFDPTAYNTITVAGAGTAAANGVYTWNQATGTWNGPTTYYIFIGGVNWIINDGTNDMFTIPATSPLPAETGWIVDQGTGPAPTISYTG